MARALALGLAVMTVACVVLHAAPAQAKLGFDVFSAENVGRRAMSRALVELESKIESGDTALIYFAGHGFAVDGTNYLLPVGVPAAGPGERVSCAMHRCGEPPLGPAAGEGAQQP